METYCVSCKKNSANKNYQNVLFVARKNQLSLKIKKLTTFEMINE